MMAGPVFIRCPHCRGALIITPAAGENSQSLHRPAAALFRHSAPNFMGLDPAAGALGADIVHYERSMPVDRLVLSDVTTSLFDSVIVGLWSAAGMTALTIWQGWPWWGPLATGTLFFGLRYFDGIRLARSLLATVESVTRDTPQPAPAPSAHKVQVEIRENEHTWRFSEFDIEPEKLYALAGAVQQGESFSERTATRCGLTQEQFKNLRDKFIRDRLARWNHPTRRQQGITLTRSGEYVIQAIAGTPPPYPAAEGDSRAVAVHASTQQHAARK